MEPPFINRRVHYFAEADVTIEQFNRMGLV